MSNTLFGSKPVRIVAFLAKMSMPSYCKNNIFFCFLVSVSQFPQYYSSFSDIYRYSVPGVLSGSCMLVQGYRVGTLLKASFHKTELEVEHPCTLVKEMESQMI